MLQREIKRSEQISQNGKCETHENAFHFCCLFDRSFPATETGPPIQKCTTINNGANRTMRTKMANKSSRILSRRIGPSKQSQNPLNGITNVHKFSHSAEDKPERKRKRKNKIIFFYCCQHQQLIRIILDNYLFMS